MKNTLTFVLLAACITATLQCIGLINVSVVNENSQIERIVIEGVNLFSAYPVRTPFSGRLPPPNQEDYSGENYVTINEHNIQLFPAGKLGVNRIYLFNPTDTTWETINVYCSPLGVAYLPSRDEITGFCAVNATYGSSKCVPYFTLALQNGKWVDISESGYCSDSLSTVNITNAVILQKFDTDYEPDVVRLYFAELGTSRLHEVNLAERKVAVYDLPKYGGAELKITDLVLANAGDQSFHGLRTESHIDNSSSIYHTLIALRGQELEFADNIIKTEQVAFDSYNLNYLVTFANRRTLVIIKQDGHKEQFSLHFTLDDPIQCHNMLIGPNTHYLICQAGGGLLINISNEEVTNQIILVDNSTVVGVGRLTYNTFYVLTSQRKMLFFLLDSELLHLGSYTVSSVNIRVTESSGNFSCSNYVQVSAQDDHKTVLLGVCISISTVLIVTFFVVIYAIRYWIKRNNSQYAQLESNSLTSECSSNEIVSDEQNEATDDQTCLNSPLVAAVSGCIGNERQPIADGNSDNSNHPSLPAAAGLHLVNTVVTMDNPQQCTSDDQSPSYHRPSPIGQSN